MHKPHFLIFLTTYEFHNYIYTWCEKDDAYIGLRGTFGCTLTNLVNLSFKKKKKKSMNRCTHADDLKTQKINARHRWSKIQEIAWKVQTIDMACNDWIWYWTNIKNSNEETAWENHCQLNRFVPTRIEKSEHLWYFCWTKEWIKINFSCGPKKSKLFKTTYYGDISLSMWHCCHHKIWTIFQL